MRRRDENLFEGSYRIFVLDDGVAGCYRDEADARDEKRECDFTSDQVVQSSAACALP